MSPPAQFLSSIDIEQFIITVVVVVVVRTSDSFKCINETNKTSNQSKERRNISRKLVALLMSVDYFQKIFTEQEKARTHVEFFEDRSHRQDKARHDTARAKNERTNLKLNFGSLTQKHRHVYFKKKRTNEGSESNRERERQKTPNGPFRTHGHS